MNRDSRSSAAGAIDWLERTKDLPTAPGVYVMRAANDEVVYVGKAKNLKSRVRQYFQEGTSDYRAFIALLGDILSDIDTIITKSEKEALLLERELIRKHEPRFNVIWRDDKQFLMLRVDPDHEWPWVQVVRNAKNDKAEYFGPFHSASAARQTLRVLNRHFQLRTCRDSVLYHRKRPCIEHQIGRCPAPCCLPVERAVYRQNVDDVLMFLGGKKKELRERLSSRMWEASSSLEYERAAHYRDQLRAVEKTLERQNVADAAWADHDVFAVHREDPDLGIAMLEVRGGRVTNVEQYFYESVSASDAEVLASFVLQRYEGREPPPELSCSIELEEVAVIEEILSEKRERRVRISAPQRGDKAKLVAMARENAEHALQDHRVKSGAAERTLRALEKGLNLTRTPLRIECFDISNLGGQLIVGSMVSFERGVPNKSRYRRFRVKTAQGQDDFASMYEVLSRRCRRGLREEDFPDLMVIDGGKGQLNVARTVFRDLGVRGVDLVSLAKSRFTGDDAADARSPERVFLPGETEPVVLDQRSPELLLLARIRDEAHRFAITFHQELRRRSRTRSALEDVPGIGPARRRALLRHFGSMRRLREATLDDI
ncbi:MAG: excinuclease ABC subunit UvrC, partial [Myxococcales bacterium]|nr:excinuclease ABC subunit UvrC [Myxococcales bacterium]